MGDRRLQLKVEEVVYWPHQVSGTNVEPWSSGGSRLEDRPEETAGLKRLCGRIFVCLFKK